MSFYLLSPLPTTAGGTGTVVRPTLGQVPVGNADGTYTPGSAGGGGTPGGSTTQFQYNNAGSFGGSGNLVYDATNVQINNAAAFRFSNVTTNYVAFKAPATIASNVTWTLPSTDGTAGQVLSTNGSGVLSWVTVTITPQSPTNNTLPVVSGTTTVGETLSSTTGTWNGYPAPTYSYQWIRGAATNIGTNSPAYQLVDADLGSTIKCTVTATNSAGTASATSATTANIAAGAPQAPTGVTATGGNTQATISFSAPAITGGSPITGYTVTSSPPGGTSSGLSLSQTVTGLTNGVSYTFTVTATNAIGTGPASTASNAVTPALAPSSVEYLVVGGGGGGGGAVNTAIAAGGGGAGGYRTSASFSIAAATPYTITVGSFGAGGAASFTGNGTKGSDSVFSTITSTGGGGGGAYQASAGTGGSGGGSADGLPGFTTGGAGNTPSVSPSQGNSGGNGLPYNSSAGGGGGASASGGAATVGVGGNGGNGTASSITGSSVTYAGGGGAGGYFYISNITAGSGGSGGGGAGGFDAVGTIGTANLGGGGGGSGVGATGSRAGANGGAGVVVIAYPDSFGAPTISGGLVYDQPTRSGYRVYRFTSGTGTITW